MSNTICTREFEFTLVLGGIQDVTEEIADKLIGSGCDDATLSVQHGAVCLEFCRESASMMDAILTAIRDVLNSGVDGIRVLQVDECNLVTLSEIARRSDRSKQLIHQYIAGRRGPGGFPPPACCITDKSPLWRWCEVSNWLFANNMIRNDVRDEAEVIAAFNIYLERLQHICRNREIMHTIESTLSDVCVSPS